MKYIGIQNFRNFGKMEHFDFAPLTILTGTNNSGKSSLSKALLLVKKNLAAGWLWQKINFKDRELNLGDFASVFNNKAA